MPKQSDGHKPSVGGLKTSPEVAAVLKIKENLNQDGTDRRGFLECMAWAGTGLIWTVSGGVLSSKAFGQMPHHQMGESAGFRFVQISDSHIGFNKEANKDVTATLQEAIHKINALEHAPDFLIHTGDLSHLSKPTEFDTLDQALRSAQSGQTFFVPGEHDMLADNGQQYLERYGKGTKGAGWYSFDHKGVHFIALVNVIDLKAGGLGTPVARRGNRRRDCAGRPAGYSEQIAHGAALGSAHQSAFYA